MFWKNSSKDYWKKLLITQNYLLIIKYVFIEFQVGPALLIETIRLQKYVTLSLCPQSTVKSEKLTFEYLKIKKNENKINSHEIIRKQWHVDLHHKG